MIEKIILTNTIPFSSNNQIMEPKHINFIFGLNATGKTTISNLIRDFSQSNLSNSQIKWKNNPIDTYVYNNTFINENFSGSLIKGIFTLGKQNIELEKQIEEKEKSVLECEKKIDELSTQITSNDPDSINSQLTNLDDKYTNIFWQQKRKLDEDESPLTKVLTGYRNSKSSFKDKILNTPPSKEKSKTQSELENLFIKAFDKNIEKFPTLYIPSFSIIKELEDHEILKKVVVGSKDLPISDFIKKHNIEGWFKEGVEHLKKGDKKTCPFCQRALEQNFISQINKYFDETYANAVNEIESINEKYCQESDFILSKLDSILPNPPKILDFTLANSLLEQLRSTFNENKLLIQKKVNTPNIVTTLRKTEKISSQITQEIQKANRIIGEHNDIVDKIKEVQQDLSNQVWSYLRDNLSDDIANYKAQKELLLQSRLKIQTEVQKINNKLTQDRKDLKELQKGITGTTSTANEINRLLKNYGITSFELQVENDKYKFVRLDGSDAFRTMSEGERNLVTFLYFIYSLNEVSNAKGLVSEKVVVIDDPVSSLDNGILFLVSSLIRSFFDDIYSEKGKIKQIFILSHNTFFFKEVSYFQHLPKSKINKTGYWIISKKENISTIKFFNENPITSTYEMLWKEVRQAKNSHSAVSNPSLANTMRRIIEHYFRILGGKEPSCYYDGATKEEKTCILALMSWLNSNSHSSFDDYAATANMYSTENFMEAFRQIFICNNQIGHYDMMMSRDES